MGSALIDQVVIAVCGVASAFLSQAKNFEPRRYACLFGLFSEPFWMYSTWHAEQWGIFLLAWLYTWAWGRGLWLYWILPWQDRRRAEADSA